ncbi:hypothetical protein Cantr_09043 [Candida viswanathii]|uniref:Uncharacterized protein n=1 Tax=Candida viswanathii TaxID=5486 RepID=A0A367YAD3_9ASCO|nr:hypothetical protein Cantr_09043 [Candida viswanathii]
MFRLTRPIQTMTRSSASASAVTRTRIVSFNSRRFIGDSTFGKPTWSLSSSIFRNFGQEARKFVQWALAFLTLLIIWPLAIVKGFDAVDHVPRDTGSQVQLKRVGFDKYDATVEIPQVYVKPDKDVMDEGDDVPEDEV